MREETGVDYTSGTQSWRLVLTRAVTGLLRRRRGGRQRGWSLGVPLIALAAGLLFTTTATTARGTALRDDRRPELADRKSTRLNSSHANISYAVFCLKK